MERRKDAERRDKCDLSSSSLLSYCMRRNMTRREYGLIWGIPIANTSAEFPHSAKLGLR